MHAPAQAVSEPKTTDQTTGVSAYSGFAFEDNRPEAAAQRRLKAVSESYVPIIQLKKVAKLTPGKLNVVGEDHEQSQLRRGDETALAGKNQLGYKMEDQARGTDASIDGDFTATYGDPPWLRELNRSYHVVYETGRFVRHVQAGKADVTEIYGKLSKYLEFSFEQRKSWWPHRRKLYKGSVHQFDNVNERVFETCFQLTEQCLAIATGLAELYNKKATGKELPLLNITRNVKTGEPVAVIKAALTDTAWIAACNTVNENLAATFGVYFGMSKAAFGKVSTRRTDLMHEWAAANSNQPTLWKIGDDHIGEIEGKYGTETAYDYMTMADFERYFTGSAAAVLTTASAAGSGGGAAGASIRKPVSAEQPKVIAKPEAPVSAPVVSGAADGSNVKSLTVKTPVAASGAVRSRRDFGAQSGQQRKPKKAEPDINSGQKQK